MKAKIRLIVSLICLSTVVHSQNIYKNSKYNYSFSIPTGWKTMPKSEIDWFATQTNQLYDAILCLNSNGISDWEPPIIFSIFKKKALKKEDYEVMANLLIKAFKKSLMPQNNNLSGYVKDINPGEGYYDKKNQCIIYMFEAENKRYGKGFYLTTSFFTPNGLLSIQLSVDKKDYLKYLPIYSQLLNSIKK